MSEGTICASFYLEKKQTNYRENGRVCSTSVAGVWGFVIILCFSVCLKYSMIRKRLFSTGQKLCLRSRWADREATDFNRRHVDGTKMRRASQTSCTLFHNVVTSGSCLNPNFFPCKMGISILPTSPDVWVDEL